MESKQLYLLNLDKDIPFDFCKSIAAEHNLAGMIVSGNQAISAKRLFNREVIPALDFPWGMSAKEHKLMGIKWYYEKGFNECMITLPINGIVDEGSNFLLDEVGYLSEGAPSKMKLSWHIGSIELAFLDNAGEHLSELLTSSLIKSIWIGSSERLSWKDNIKINRKISKNSREIGLILSEEEASAAVDYTNNGIDRVAIEANAVTKALYPIKGGKL